MRSKAIAVLLAIGVAGCAFVGLDTASRWCSWSGIAFAFQGHTTLGEAGLPSGGVDPDEPGELIVTADPVPVITGAAPDFSAPPTEPRQARMYCFHPDDSNTSVRGELPDGWQPPHD